MVSTNCSSLNIASLLRIIAILLLVLHPNHAWFSFSRLLSRTVKNAPGHLSVLGSGSSDIHQSCTITEMLCKNCKTYYDPSRNHERACRYHPKHYSGDTKRKADWSASADRFATQKMYWCCGEEDENAPGCKYDRHRSYDDE